MANEKYWKSKFEEQQELMHREFPDEEFVQCLDKESFDGRFYQPAWCVSAEAHVWSLAKRGELPQSPEKCGPRNRNGELTQEKYFARNSNRYACGQADANSTLRISTHTLVANYFCDKTAIDIYGEDNVVVHHIFGFDSSQSSQWNNRADHIQYVRTPDHYILCAIQAGLTVDNALKRYPNAFAPDDYNKFLLQLGKYSDAKKLYNGTVLIDYSREYDGDYMKITRHIKVVQPLLENQRPWYDRETGKIRTDDSKVIHDLVRESPYMQDMLIQIERIRKVVKSDITG